MVTPLDAMQVGHITYYPELVQGSDEWLAARCGLLTASEMKYIITPSTLKAAKNADQRAHLYELLAQRITGYVEPAYVSDDMLRGQQDEIDARQAYNKEYGGCSSMGFITNSKWGFTLGYSPDALVGDDGLIECKSRRQKFQVETILSAAMPDEYRIQVQTGLLVTERRWCDFVSYCGGMPMITMRVFPEPDVQTAILDAANAFEAALTEKLKEYRQKVEFSDLRLIPTVRRIIENEITL
jgi:hypothetical protein